MSTIPDGTVNGGVCTANSNPALSLGALAKIAYNEASKAYDAAKGYADKYTGGLSSFVSGGLFRNSEDLTIGDIKYIIEEERKHQIREAKRRGDRIERFSLGSIGAVATGGVAGLVLKHLGGHGGSNPPPPGKAFINVADAILTTSILGAINSQISATSSTEKIDFDCDEKEDLANTAGAQSCSSAVLTILENRRQMERELFLTYEHETPPDTDFKDTSEYKAMNDFGDTCKAAIRNCHSEGLQQAQNIIIDFSEFDGTAMAEQVKTNIKTTTSTVMTQMNDVLGDLGQLLNQSNECIAADISNRIAQVDLTQLINELRQFVNTAQEFKVTDGSDSVYVARVKQSISLKSVAGMVSKAKLTNNMFTQEEESVAQNFFNKNDTLNQLVDDLAGTIEGAQNIFESTVFLTIITMAAVLVGIVLIAGITYILYPDFVRELLNPV